MKKLAGQMLTTRGVAAFWLLWCLAFVLMLWAVSPGRTLQDALAAELLQDHLAGGYQLRNPPLYEWLLWAVQQVFGPGPLSYLILRYSLIGHRHSVHHGASAHGRERAPCRRLFPLARAALLVRLGNPSQRLPYTCAARGVACAVDRSAHLCRAADGGARICAWPHYRHRPHG